MPAIAAQAAARAAGSGKIRGGHLLILVALAAGGVFLLLTGVRKSAGGLKVPASTTEASPVFTPPPEQPVASVDQHIGGVVYTPHRYPHTCGHEISALINGGHPTLFLPHERDMDWLRDPPSEATL